MHPSDPYAAEVSPIEAARLFQTGAVTLLDVREHYEWDAGHAAGATHIPLRELRLPAVDTSRPVVVVCHSGHRSAAATAHLRAAGIDARNMTGGMAAWAHAGLGTVTDDGRPGAV